MLYMRLIAGDAAYLDQVQQMLAGLGDPDRTVRSQSECWDTPFGAAYFGLAKAQRVIATEPCGGHLTGSPAKQAEELREAASYFLRAAQLIEAGT